MQNAFCRAGPVPPIVIGFLRNPKYCLMFLHHFLEEYSFSGCAPLILVDLDPLPEIIAFDYNGMGKEAMRMQLCFNQSAFGRPHTHLSSPAAGSAAMVY